MSKRKAITGLALSILAVGPAEVAAQERSELRLDGPVGVQATVVAELSFEGLDRAPDVLATTFRLPDGGWGVSSRVFDGVIQRFDAEAAPERDRASSAAPFPVCRSVRTSRSSILQTAVSACSVRTSP